jgi:hypothetical protein
MSMIEMGRADHIQRLADAVMAEASTWDRKGDWFFCEPTVAEAEFVLDGELSPLLRVEVACLTDQDRDALIGSLVPLISGAYQDQQDMIEEMAVHTALEISATELERLLLDQDLSPPEKFDLEVALEIRELAEETTLEDLEILASSTEFGPKFVARHRDALVVRRAMDA